MLSAGAIGTAIVLTNPRYEHLYGAHTIVVVSTEGQKSAPSHSFAPSCSMT